MFSERNTYVTDDLIILLDLRGAGRGVSSQSQIGHLAPPKIAARSPSTPRPLYFLSSNLVHLNVHLKFGFRWQSHFSTAGHVSTRLPTRGLNQQKKIIRFVQIKSVMSRKCAARATLNPTARSSLGGRLRPGKRLKTSPTIFLYS